MFVWTDEQERVFKEMRFRLTNHPVLKLFNPDALCSELHADARSYGLAGMVL